MSHDRHSADPRTSEAATATADTSDSTNDPDPSSDSSRRGDVKLAALGGLAAAIVGGGGMAVVGAASAFEAKRLLDAVLPAVRFAASAYVAGGGTILALMLTLITFSINQDLDFRSSHYERIRTVAKLTTVVIAGSVVLLMFSSFPLGEAEVEQGWYVWVYYAVVLGGAAAGGVFISVILMLYYAVRELVSLGEDASTSQLLDKS